MNIISYLSYFVFILNFTEMPGAYQKRPRPKQRQLETTKQISSYVYQFLFNLMVAI